jgi:hypothetical protein
MKIVSSNIWKRKKRRSSRKEVLSHSLPRPSCPAIALLFVRKQSMLPSPRLMAKMLHR